MRKVVHSDKKCEGFHDSPFSYTKAQHSELQKLKGIEKHHFLNELQIVNILILLSFHRSLGQMV